VDAQCDKLVSVVIRTKSTTVDVPLRIFSKVQSLRHSSRGKYSYFGDTQISSKRSVWHVEGSRSAQNQLYPFCNLDRTHADLWWTYECLFIALSLALIINCRLYGVFKNPLSLIICVMLGDVKLQYLTWPVQRCSHVTFQHFWMLNRSTVSTFKNVEPSTADTFSIR